MKMLSQFTALALLAIPAFSAVTTEKRDIITFARSSAGSKGAAYFMTNEDDKNFIISANIKADGSLSLARATSTRGRGLHGKNGPPLGPDGLFSQGSVVVSGHVLAVVNAGSNTVSTFTINEKDPSQIWQLGEPASSEGEFPIALAMTKDASRLCVLNGGAIAGVNCFSIDAKLGLRAIPGSLRYLALNQTTPANGPPGTASHIIFSDDESQLIASVKGVPPTPGYLAIWNIKKDGSLADKAAYAAPPSGGVLPFGMNIIPGKGALVVADPAVGVSVFDLKNTKMKAGSNSTAAGKTLTVAGQGAICWTSYSPKTGHYYLSDAGQNAIFELSVDSKLAPKIVNRYNLTAMSTPIDSHIATVGSQDFMYQLAPNRTEVAVLSLQGSGKAKVIQKLDVSQAKKHGVHINAINLQGMATFVRKQ